MSLPFVSVIIDTYNYGCFIEEAIDSVLAQEFPQDRMEVLVVDDGSTDDTSERVKKYGGRIKYFRKENGGQASALNLGFSHSSGNIICFLDADDYWLPNKLRRVVEEFENGPAGMVNHAYELSVPDSKGNKKHKLDFISGNLAQDLELLLRCRVFPTSCSSFRREALKCLMPIPEAIRLQTDAFLFRVAAFVAPVSALPETLTVYRTHGKNLFYVEEDRVTRESHRRSQLMRRTINREIRRWLRRNGFNTRTGEVRIFLDRLELFWLAEDMSVFPPTRLQWFHHVLQYNRTYRTRQNWKLTVLNYLTAIATLVWGYGMPRPQKAPPEEGHHA